MLTTAPSTSSTSSAPQPRCIHALHSDTCSTTISFTVWSGGGGSEQTADTSPSGCSGDSASSATCISDTPATCGRESLVWRSTVASSRPPSVPLRVVVVGGGGEWCWSGEEPDRRGGTKPCRASLVLGKSTSARYTKAAIGRLSLSLGRSQNISYRMLKKKTHI
jgi:hypothetical protein